MSKNLLRTKLYIPAVQPRSISRQRLTDRLNAGFGSSGRFVRKLTLISAPAGFGKTTLLSDWSQSSKYPVAWLSLDKDDNQPHHFWRYIVAALETVDTSIGQSVWSALSAPQKSPLEEIVKLLINEIVALDTPLVLVLDDYHFITTETIHSSLCYFVEHLPSQIHLVISSRTVPPLPLARLRARGELAELGQADLRFALDEAARFLRQTMRLDLTAKVIKVLKTRTEGWIAGLQLAALALKTSRRVQGQCDLSTLLETLSGDHRYIADYLTTEVLQQQPAVLRDFLYQTAILDRLTAPLCDVLTDRDDSQDILEQLEQNNLFLVSLDNRREWYRYHRLFVDWLRTRADGPESTSLHQKAARWFAAHGFVQEAIKHALAAGDVEKAGQLIIIAAQDAFKDGDPTTTFLDWLDALPDEFVRANHELATFKGCALIITGQVQAAESYAESAKNNLPADASRASRGLLTSLCAHLAIPRGDFVGAVELSIEALELVGDSNPVLRSANLTNLANAQMMIGDIAATTKAFQQAIGPNYQLSDNLAAVSAAGNFASLLNLQGRRLEAQMFCQKVIAQCIDAQGNPLPIADTVYMTLGTLYYEANELSQTRRYLHQAIELGQQSSWPGVPLKSKIWLAKLQQAMGEEVVALATIGEACRAAPQLAVWPVIGLAQATEADIQLKQGNIAAASCWAETANLAPTDQPHYLKVPEYFPYVRLLLVQKQPSQAQTLLTNLECSAGQQGLHRPLITIRILQALTWRALGQEDKSRLSLEKALRLAAPQGYLRAFLDESPTLTGLLAQMRYAAPRFVDRLLHATKTETSCQTPRPSTQVDASLIAPLTKREMEVLALVAAGLSNREIASRLYISIGTVKTHVHNIYSKLNVRDRPQAIVHTRKLNLFN